MGNTVNINQTGDDHNVQIEQIRASNLGALTQTGNTNTALINQSAF